MKKKYTLSILLIIIALSCFSNNITISNATLVGKNTVDGYTLIQFDLSWDNSWRTGSGPSNWDAAWVFIKFRIKGQTDWQHATLNRADGTGTGDGHTVPAGAIIKGDIDTQDGNSLGVFIYSNGNKPQSSAQYSGVQLQWLYRFDGVLDNELVEVSVFGIEMVYVPQGAFEVGNINQFFHSFYTYPADASAYTIVGEGLITVSGVNGNLYYNIGDQTGPIPASFPKGYKAFYCMKYEISQEQYVEFLQRLTSTQSFARAYTSGGNRNGISGAFGTFTTSNPYVACNYLSWADLAAYLDWAALRPMTELEYEKACRGTLPSVSQEYAWGTATRASDQYTLSNPLQEDEGITTNYNVALGNGSFSDTDGILNGPLRSGVFAAHPNNSGRITAGATYYAIMEMTGNVYEQVVAVGNVTGRAFTSTHGDGVLAVNGNHDAFTWPGIDAVGTGQRGGAWSSSAGFPGFHLPVSSRTLAITGAAIRENDKGGRGVRTAP